ncbi:unnamed protein product [Protopolystoma xenopodis]|uniref:Uncharacterized protein n=1 Tax=Protopolystoma xenopodis TaxID=117903 RepID=A0A448XRR2_9PLAT|nr:unnamed protein product [Protopolystoma xenopodis]
MCQKGHLTGNPLERKSCNTLLNNVPKAIQSIQSIQSRHEVSGTKFLAHSGIDLTTFGIVGTRLNHLAIEEAPFFKLTSVRIDLGR